MGGVAGAGYYFLCAFIERVGEGLAEQGKESTNDRFVAKMEELFNRASEREDRNLSKMLEPAIEAAKHPAHNGGPIVT